MIKFIFTVVVCLVAGIASAANTEDVSEQTDLIKIMPQPSSTYAFGGGGNILYSNGPLINSPETGVGGADESILQDLSLGLNTLGIGHQQNAGTRVSDEFIVENDGLFIETIDFFAYQTNEQASSITAVNLQIWDGPPGQIGSQIIFGDTTTNRMLSTQFSGILRVAELDSGANNIRQIAVSSVFIDLTFDAGTYWLDWQSIGSGASGPWAPPISITGSTNTGNALRSLDNGMTYEPVLDAGLNTPLGIPFILRGTLPPPEPVNYLNNTMLLFIVFLTLILGQAFIINRSRQ